LQRVPIQSPNNNTESVGSFQEDLSSHVEVLQYQPMDEIVVEKDLEVKCTLSGSKESNDVDDDVDADIDDEMSPKSAKPIKGKKVRVCENFTFQH
jgi:hypothetical protein